jgi:hypothetical protein
MLDRIGIDPANHIVEDDPGEDFCAQLRVMFADQGGGRDPGIVVVLGNDGSKSRCRHFPHEVEMIERPRRNGGATVHVGIYGVLQDGVDARLLVARD